MKTEQKKLPKSQIEISFELTADEFVEHYNHAIEHLKHHVKVDGFREGKAPASLIEEKIKPEALLMEAGEHAVQHVYSDYIRENKLEPVGHPEVSIEKIAKGSPFVFKATVTVLPDVELPNYKEIAKTVKGKEVSVSEEEVQDSLNYLQKSRAKMTPKSGDAASGQAQVGDFVEIEYQSQLATAGKEVKDQFILGEGGFVKGFEDGIFGMKAGEEKEFSVSFPKDYHGKEVAGKEAMFKIKMVSVQKMEMPEINDDFAKTLGAFDSLVALKTNIKEGMEAEKKEAEKQRVRGEILEKIAEKAKFEMPEAMVEYEQQQLLDDLKNRIESTIKVSFEQYLASVKKTEAEIRETYKKEAEKRLRGFLVLRALGKQEKVEVSDAEIDAEVDKALNREALRQAQGEIDRSQFREYTKGVIMNEKIFQSLENFSA